MKDEGSRLFLPQQLNKYIEMLQCDVLIWILQVDMVAFGLMKGAIILCPDTSVVFAEHRPVEVVGEVS